MDQDERPTGASEFLPTRHTLLSRLKNSEDQAGWEEFFATYWKLIYRTCREAGLSDAEAQDVVQETVISVSKHLPGFQYDPQTGSFKAWLLRVTRWRIRDEVRRRRRGAQTYAGHDAAELAELLPDMATNRLESLWNEEYDNHLLEAAIERVKQQVDPGQFQIFDLYVLQKWTVPRICAFLKTNRGRVYLAKHRIARLIKKEVLALEQKWLKPA